MVFSWGPKCSAHIHKMVFPQGPSFWWRFLNFCTQVNNTCMDRVGQEDSIASIRSAPPLFLSFGTLDGRLAAIWQAVSTSVHDWERLVSTTTVWMTAWLLLAAIWQTVSTSWLRMSCQYETPKGKLSASRSVTGKLKNKTKQTKNKTKLTKSDKVIDFWDQLCPQIVSC